MTAEAGAPGAATANSVSARADNDEEACGNRMPFLALGAGGRPIDMTYRASPYWDTWRRIVSMPSCSTVVATDDDQPGRRQHGNQVERTQ